MKAHCCDYQGVIQPIDSDQILPDGHMDEHMGRLEAPGIQRAAQKVTRKVRKSLRQRGACVGRGTSVAVF